MRQLASRLGFLPAPPPAEPAGALLGMLLPSLLSLPSDAKSGPSRSRTRWDQALLRSGGIVFLIIHQAVAKLFTTWTHDWLKNNLRPHQQSKTWSQKSSIFGALVRNTFGSKAFLLAMFQCGLNIMPSGAPEHAW